MNKQLNSLRALLDQMERWEQHINSALAYTNLTHTFDDIVGMIMSNRVLFFSYEKAFVIMEKVQYPQFNVFHCFLAGGDMEAVMDAEKELMKIGLQLDCKYLSIAGRKGWLRLLEPRGWQHLCTTMYKLIEEQPDEQWQRKGRAANGHSGASRRN